MPQPLEAIQIRAVERIQAGAHSEDVAASLGITRSTVFAWLVKFREGGMEALHTNRCRDAHPSSPARG